MKRVYHAPERLPYYAQEKHYYKVFLAGSIEMGVAINWQDKVLKQLEPIDKGVVFFNPRRPDWNSSWEQKESHAEFNKQVTWEMDHLDKADMVIFYFDPNTKSPISLLELGLMAEQSTINKKIIVYCPEGFWRKGNVDVVCTRYGLKKYDDENDFLEAVHAITREQAGFKVKQYRFFIDAYAVPDYAQFEQEIKTRRQLLQSMVGTLYPNMVMDEISELVKIRDQIFDFYGKRRNN